ncbi:hypothetical protein BVC80_393g18 [Macleaya cordata]|uniref:Uncharacterized protein n=1 Tax=Macleaya cordata TaxID=56857 RepID=A0A200R178_MACCD|nr:hypothetical protein BVC80_393g18 [Macleaya cordata]
MTDFHDKDGNVRQNNIHEKVALFAELVVMDDMTPDDKKRVRSSRFPPILPKDISAIGKDVYALLSLPDLN